MADKYEKPKKKERRTVEEDNRNQVYTVKRGGRYTEGKTKDGRPYRRYF